MDVRCLLGRGWFVLGCATGLALLSACASTPPATPGRAQAHGDTSYRAVDRGDLAHYELALGQVASGAAPREHPAPVYPASLLDAKLPPREIAARLIVDTQGKVSEVRIDDEAQADPQQRLFDAAVRTAAMQWTFEPLTISQWAADANGNSHMVGSETQAFSLDFVFRFAWKDGKPVTDADAATQPPALRHSDD